MHTKERNLDDVVQALRFGKDQGRKCSLLIGAGCSVAAGIPTASGFVQRIEDNFPGAYQQADPKTYLQCMAKLTPGERRELIARAVDDAKVNWGHVAIAELMRAGYVDRVLTTNFDPLVVRACALAGIYPAVYDFAASQLLKPAQIPDKAVFHLHGQRTGFVLLNTAAECEEQADRLSPLFQDASQGRTWVVVGYSGDNDPVFDLLADVPVFEYGLYWVGYGDVEPASHVRARLLAPPENYAYLVRGFDADSFFIQLARELNCFPPAYVERPFSHLSRMMDMLTPMRASLCEARLDRTSESLAFESPIANFQRNESDVDVTAQARDWIDEAIQHYEAQLDEPRSAGGGSIDAIEAAATALFMAGKYREMQDLVAVASEPSPRTRELLAWSFFNEATHFAVRARLERGPQRDHLFAAAYEKFSAALAINPDHYEIFNNWGLSLTAQAIKKPAPDAARLLVEACGKYQAALELKSDNNQALSNWGIALQEQANRKTGAEADRLFTQAREKYREALDAMPDDFRTLYNWGYSLASQARTKRGVDADRLFADASQKYQEALAVKPDMVEALYQWGNALADHAKAKLDAADAEALLSEACEKYQRAIAIKPNMHIALNAWGLALHGQAKIKRGADADRLFDLAYDKYRRALTGAPKMDAAFFNWGLALKDQATTKSGVDADHLLNDACEKYQLALAIKPNKHRVLNNWGLALAVWAAMKNGDDADRLFAAAYEKYGDTLAVKPDYFEALYNWGLALSTQALTKSGAAADDIYVQAYGKYRAAIEIKPDLHEAFGAWGCALLNNAILQDGANRERIIALAIERLVKAQQYGSARASLDLAVAAALQGDMEAAKKHLVAAKASRVLPNKEYVQNSPGLSSLRGERWFQEFVETLPEP